MSPPFIMIKRHDYLVVTDWIGLQINAYIPCNSREGAKTLARKIKRETGVRNRVVKRTTTYEEIKIWNQPTKPKHK